MKATIDWLETKVWFRVVLLIISYLLLPIIYFSTAIPLLLYRLLAVGTAAWFRPGFVALSPESGLTTVDNFYTDGEVEHAVVGCHYTDKVIQRKDVVERMQEVINSRRVRCRFYLIINEFKHFKILQNLSWYSSWVSKIIKLLLRSIYICT